MSIFNAIKRAFGFGGDDVETYEDDPLYADTAAEAESADTPAAAAAGAAGEGPADAEHTDAPAPMFDPAVKQRIFEHVTDTFTAALPDFLSRSADPEAQRRLLMEGLESDIKAYMDSLMAQAEAHCARRWESRRSDMAAELETLRSRAGEMEKRSSDIREKQLSADRQKRALSERVHDLESQLARAEAECEQYQLENRSLLNRLKVADVLQADAVAATPAPAPAPASAPAPAPEPSPEIEAEMKEMKDGIDSLKEQLRVAGEMQDDLRKRLAEKETELEKAQATTEKLKAKLAEAAAREAEYAEIDEKMKLVDDAISQREEKIKTLKQKAATLSTRVESLQSTIRENLRMQGEHEKELNDEIAALKARLAAVITVPPAPEIAAVAEDESLYGHVDEAPRISDSELSALEETFETEEWFTKTPPPQTPSMRAADEEVEFGYRAPKRKSSPANNPNQLSLF